MTGGPLGAFSYDSQNRLTQAGNITYTYDAENNRVAMATGDSTTSYVYDTNAAMSRMLVSTDGNGNKTYYVYGNGLIGSYDSSNNYAAYHYDYRGSTTALTNSSGQVTDTYTYGTYGNLTSHTGVSPTAFLFNGRDGVQTDSNGLYYMRARYYSPTLLRFVNADTLTGSIQNSETLNRFAYANGNQINFTDPFGRSAEPGNINYNADNNLANGTVSNGLVQIGLGSTVTWTTAGAFADSTVATTVSGWGYAMTTPWAIASHVTDPYLNTNEKIGLSTMEVGLGAGGVLLTIGLVNIWNPAGWVTIGAGLLYTFAAYEISSNVTEYYDKKNGMVN